MTVARRFVSAIGANLSGQVITTVIQLASVPIFLKYWSLAEYGNWLLLAAIPSYFALADVGFLGVSINKMSILAAAGKFDEVNVVFQTAIKLCLIAVSISLSIAILVAALLDFQPLIGFDNKLALVLLVASALIAMSAGLFDAVFRAVGRFALGAYLVNFARLFEWFGLIVGLVIGKSFLAAAVGQVLCRIIVSAVIFLFSRKYCSRIVWGVKNSSSVELKLMIKPALSFLAFPAANAINIQGMTLLVGHLFGTSFLAIFNTYRTISRILVQAVTIIGRSLWPEVSRAFGNKDFRLILQIYKRGTVASILLASIVSVFLFFFGDFLLAVWTSSRIPFDRTIFSLFLLATVLTSFWQMGMVVLSATNTHIALAIYFVFASLFSLMLVYLLSFFIGNKSSVLSLIALEVFLIFSCLINFQKFRKTHGDSA